MRDSEESNINSDTHWTVYANTKTPKFPPSNPESLMSDIDTAILNLEYSRATAYLDSRASLSAITEDCDEGPQMRYDAKLADEAYRAGCAALAARKLDDALHSLNVSLSMCPPDKTSAVAKLQSLISLTSQQLNKDS